ncbi:hypothetical protein AWC02_05780 [Mycolicibacter engbaekii]|uniref:Uncharacterized protein n=1 Tax=Mycolicibacter engbaekii TaxID=188915 RepID=A0A1X1TZR4_9MYCO|nr:cytochrome c biogenesis protein CcdA [Mycolicibacter engbaekii]ORV50072.1 hypothetical protein AWC02_05780 [Mycolicibacter engbaekii]
MNPDLPALAFAAGLVAALNPCGFALLPAYLALVVRGQDVGTGVAVGRALAATAAMTLGFLAVFGAFGLLTVAVAQRVQQYLPYVTVVIGAALVVMGVWLLAGRRLAIMSFGGRWAPTARIGSMFGYGAGYACASLGCTIGPFLAVTGAALPAGPSGMLVYLAYAAGFGLLVGVLAVAVALASSALIARMRRITRYAGRVSGALLVAVGLYVGYYGYYEIRLFERGAGADDRVLAVAGRLQGALAGWVHQQGAWPWLSVLALLALAALVRARRPGH